MDSIVPYDAIVLQYGLNVMTPEILHYGSYARKMTEVVRHLRECYPHTDIILMGVGDRSRKANGAFGYIRGDGRAQRNARLCR